MRKVLFYFLSLSLAILFCFNTPILAEVLKCEKEKPPSLSAEETKDVQETMQQNPFFIPASKVDDPMVLELLDKYRLVMEEYLMTLEDSMLVQRKFRSIQKRLDKVYRGSIKIWDRMEKKAFEILSKTNEMRELETELTNTIPEAESKFWKAEDKIRGKIKKVKKALGPKMKLKIGRASCRERV